MEVKLRQCRKADLRAMYALDVVCFAPEFRFSRRAMRRFAEAQEALTVLAEVQAELAGFVIVQCKGSAGYVVTLDVAPAWRKQGLAGRLMVEVETRARAAGMRGMELHVSADNAGAIRFYEASGYRLLAVVGSFYGRGLDALAFGKELAGAAGGPAE